VFARECRRCDPRLEVPSVLGRGLWWVVVYRRGWPSLFQFEVSPYLVPPSSHTGTGHIARRSISHFPRDPCSNEVASCFVLTELSPHSSLLFCYVSPHLQVIVTFPLFTEFGVPHQLRFPRRDSSLPQLDLWFFRMSLPLSLTTLNSFPPQT